ncbi:esterase family protein [Microbacterium sp. RU33B]|uniref:alpha/beta hydrolase n=1 Tax=Microbacterium sp. RU33B TaxID=1907390 RepID=UPI0009590273|nr:alpha/beta hydrolase-fold protein [Microbacterium sp. RU33B]SIT85468.1 Enterochelin esterase [Microbacterium sp. RU33B]
MSAFWSMPVIDGPLPWIVFAVALGVLVCLLWRRWTARTALVAAVAAAAGALVALAVYFVSNATGAFGDPLPQEVLWWAMGAFAAIGLAIASLWGSATWRRIVAAFGVVVFAIAGVLGVNAYYGLNPTLGSIFGIVVENPIDMPTPDPDQTTDAGPLYQSWKPPADMPSKGQRGTQVIPATVSRFDARPAGIYLPPAALGEDAPVLPVVILMMGFPGNPDVSYAADILDDYAARHDGLAPIVVVPDQIGPSGSDPACADSKAVGNAMTYITEDVVTWIKGNLRVSADPKEWVIAGYSNGGGCAFKYMASDPDLWQNLLDVSGEEFPGSEDIPAVTASIFGGDAAAFEASKPESIMATKPGQYEGVTAVFTIGAVDPWFVPASQAASAAAKAAGMSVTYIEIPGADHGVSALTGGLQQGLKLFYPVLGLSAP